MINLNEVLPVLAVGFHWVIVLLELILVMVCWVHRRLSRWMWLVLAGCTLWWARELWSAVPSLVAAHGHQASLTLIYLLGLIGAVTGALAMLLLATGLTLVFRDLRQRLEGYRIESLRLSGDRPYGQYPKLREKGD